MVRDPTGESDSAEAIGAGMAPATGAGRAGAGTGTAGAEGIEMGRAGAAGAAGRGGAAGTEGAAGAGTGRAGGATGSAGADGAAGMAGAAGTGSLTGRGGAAGRSRTGREGALTGKEGVTGRGTGGGETGRAGAPTGTEGTAGAGTGRVGVTGRVGTEATFPIASIVVVGTASAEATPMDTEAMAFLIFAISWASLELGLSTKYCLADGLSVSPKASRSGSRIGPTTGILLRRLPIPRRSLRYIEPCCTEKGRVNNRENKVNRRLTLQRQSICVKCR